MERIAKPLLPDQPGQTTTFPRDPATVLVGWGVPAFTNIVTNNKDVGIIQVMGPHYCSGVAAVYCDVRPDLDWTGQPPGGMEYPSRLVPSQN